ncbi:acetyltransferase, ribosomal protein N-acetylase [Fervidobacterium pennivorans DSM 9078]|uniref:Acetyltransferase, ribosomal protein N-acetylase n=1 Tax=Fervidobacterium pennivorans (strain DSM 9078 / Ven5) TaxID=771875 RepID=H9UCZ0_FERPD|nr:GNAT family protein [Fervidobacterium pennivorans]AFG35383.1 acetyltransferase, ribosomal protein N-acetylase [Fervidobacterium pennivorans DSM 9078]
MNNPKGEELKFHIGNSFVAELSDEDIKYFSERRITKAEPVTLVFFFETNDGNYEKIGFVEFDLRVINKNAYITFYVAPQYRGKGIGKLIIRKALEFAFKELNLRRVTAEVYEYNERSLRLLESLGFKKEGILKEAKFHDGRYWDIIVMGLMKEDWKNSEEFRR